MRIYAVAILAFRTTVADYPVGRWDCQSLVRVALARSEAEAIGLGVIAAREAWPLADGWQGHQATAIDVGEWLVERAGDDPELGRRQAAMLSALAVKVNEAADRAAKGQEP